MFPLFWAEAQVNSLWYAVPLIIAISFVYSATRHERMGPILARGLRFGVMVTGFMGAIIFLLWLLSLAT